MGRKFPIVSSITFFIGLGIFLFIATKSAISSFTHDESYTYLYACRDSFMDLLSYKSWYSNNHILNSLFIKYSEQLFGNSELALRLPNLLLLIVYMFYCYLLFKRTNPLLAISMFVLLCTNVLLIDLFGQARGYGMSCGFMLMSMFHLVNSFNRKKTTNLLLFHLAALLAILSQFTLLTFYVSLLLVYNLVMVIESRIIYNTKYQFVKTNKLHGFAFIVVSIILYEPVRRLITYNKLDFGGKDGFYTDTVTHLIRNSLHHISITPFAMVVLKVLFTSTVLISFITIVRMIRNQNASFFQKHRGMVVSNFLVIVISATIILQHYILGRDYLIDRFSIFIFPLFVIHIGFLLRYYELSRYRKIALSISLGLAIVSTTSFAFKADMYSSAEWYYDAETKHMIQKLEAQYTNGSRSNKIKLGTNWLFEPTINFYRLTLDLDWLEPAHRNGITENDDYYYIFKDDLDKLNPLNYEIIFEFERTNTLLLKNTKGK